MNPAGRSKDQSRQRPTLPHTFACSTISSEGLNFRVRDGNGCGPFDITTGKLLKNISSDLRKSNRQPKNLRALEHIACRQPCSRQSQPTISKPYGQAGGSISTGKLNRLPGLHTQPINVVVYYGSHREN